jgi:hypothetical protein
MKRTLFMLAMIAGYSLSGLTQSFLSQTNTAANVNNLNNFRSVFGTLNFARASAARLSSDDDVYATSSRLTAVSDSSAPASSRSFSTLALQNFGFTIPVSATIQDITITLRRFRKGTAPVGDHSLSLMQRFSCDAGAPCTYGVFWTYQDSYAGKVYPEVETEYTFSQPGNGNNGGFNHNLAFEWTPAIVNHEFFGVRIDSYVPVGTGFAQIYYDLVQVTVEYVTSSASVLEQTRVLTAEWKQPVAYPNPFTTITTMQFTAAETGDAVVDLYNIVGVKVRNIFSGKVEQGQVYTVTAGGSLIAKGVYIYRIRNGKYAFAGKLLKVE